VLVCNIVASTNRTQCCGSSGAACRASSECCGTMNCVDGRCKCQAVGAACRNNGDCCSGRCDPMSRRCSM
jgi:hypothetical protein